MKNILLPVYAAVALPGALVVFHKSSFVPGAKGRRISKNDHIDKAIRQEYKATTCGLIFLPKTLHP